MEKRKIVIALCLALLPIIGYAKVVLPHILNDNMVLQQQSNVKLWGKANPNKKVKVSPSWNKEVYSTVAGSDGNWKITVATPKAGGPYELKFTDGEELILKNILIGEVWFCSGQSNVEMPVRGFEFEYVEGANDLIAKAGESTPVRIFSSDFNKEGWFRQYSKTPLDDCKGEWFTNTSENVAPTSAVAYCFAKYLQQALGIPVGIVVSSWGGSTVEAWMSEETILPFAVDLSYLREGKEVPKPIQQMPCVLFNAKVAPLTNFMIKGMIWYQGESNRHNADQYSRMLPAMVDDYRKRWGLEKLPFYYVEIAPHAYGDAAGTSAAYFREMQQGLMKVIPHSGMVSTMDIGSHDFIHPPKKKEVGRRLAYWALAKDYGVNNIGYKTPVFQSMEIKDNKAFITFENAPGKVYPMSQPLASFEIAGKDKVFYPAEATVDVKTKQLLVWSATVPEPIAVRYAFRNYAKASLFDYYGLPVAPFRTDNW